MDKIYIENICSPTFRIQKFLGHRLNETEVTEVYRSNKQETKKLKMCSKMSTRVALPTRLRWMRQYRPLFSLCKNLILFLSKQSSFTLLLIKNPFVL